MTHRLIVHVCVVEANSQASSSNVLGVLVVALLQHHGVVLKALAGLLVVHNLLAGSILLTKLKAGKEVTSGGRLQELLSHLEKASLFHQVLSLEGSAFLHLLDLLLELKAVLGSQDHWCLLHDCLLLLLPELGWRGCVLFLGQLLLQLHLLFELGVGINTTFLNETDCLPSD